MKLTTILGVRVDCITSAELIDLISITLNTSSKPKQIITVNGEIILKAKNNPKYKELINNSDIRLCDSTNLHWVSKFTPNPIPQKIPGSSLTLDICQLAQTLEKRVFLLGSKPGVAKKAATKLQELFPKLIIAGTSHANPNDPESVKEVKKSNTDIVFVAYGAPEQEFWIKENLNNAGAKIYMGVGGTFDMLAGITPRAPIYLRYPLPLEWLWRLILQPSRFKRIINAVLVFPILAIIDIAFGDKK
ncbi:WecB/TagA/CpsF family glycosyltransferase [Candidatus Berkelbacteria bacterium]|nr:WecB/TagA/CpsF family glycosyltransferase [Candidatus Berkelbacteria bacterium]